LANIKSQIKRNRQNEKRRVRNRNIRGAARTSVNQARAALEGNTPESREAVLRAISALDRAAGRRVIHRNNAARRKARLVKRLVSMGGTLPKKNEAPKAPEAEGQAEAKKKAPAKKTAAKKTAAKE